MVSIDPISWRPVCPFGGGDLRIPSFFPFPPFHFLFLESRRVMCLLGLGIVVVMKKGLACWLYCVRSRLFLATYIPRALAVDSTVCVLLLWPLRLPPPVIYIPLPPFLLKTPPFSLPCVAPCVRLLSPCMHALSCFSFLSVLLSHLKTVLLTWTVCVVCEALM